MNFTSVNFITGWISLLGGVLSGMAMGLFFHRDGWMGGYGSLRRRMLRLGHIAFFGIGFLNLFFALSIERLAVAVPLEASASVSLVVAAVTMPLCCFLTAWRTPFRHLFPLPATSVLVGVASVLIAWGQS